MCCDMQGSCPNCNTKTSTYFGDILTVKGNREKNEVQCGECGAKLQFNALKREVGHLSMISSQLLVRVAQHLLEVPERPSLKPVR